MEHCLIMAEDIDRTRDFYRDSLGMEVGYRPPLAFPGYWLYLDGVPCIHIAEWKTYSEYTSGKGLAMTTKAPSTGAVDHLAFNGTGFEEMRARFEEAGIAFVEDTLPETGLRQLFLRDPNGLKIELSFPPED
jgi:catechol 2,3-dioxygenase-like lactoylglutathione lyase family enzyme